MKLPIWYPKPTVPRRRRAGTLYWRFQQISITLPDSLAAKFLPVIAHTGLLSERDETMEDYLCTGSRPNFFLAFPGIRSTRSIIVNPSITWTVLGNLDVLLKLPYEKPNVRSLGFIRRTRFLGYEGWDWVRIRTVYCHRSRLEAIVVSA